jgi:hypothetical protein
LERLLLYPTAEVVMRNRLMSWGAALLIGMACAATQPRVKPDDMSAASHRENAARERKLAQENADRYDPGAARTTALAPPRAADDNFVFPTSVYNPTEGFLREADKHRAHAREHESAAKVLERFEAAECGELPERSRSACPLLGPVAKIDDVKRGVRVTFVPGTRVDAVVAHMRCHYAFARSHGFDSRVSCPLYMPGLQIRQVGEMAVLLESPDKGHVDELRSRSREEAVYARSGRNQ